MSASSGFSTRLVRAAPPRKADPTAPRAPPAPRGWFVQEMPEGSPCAPFLGCLHPVYRPIPGVSRQRRVKRLSHHPMQRSRTRYIALLAAAAIALYLCWRMIEPFVDVILGSGVLAIIAYPLHLALLRRTQRPSLSAALTCLILIVMVLLPLVFVTIAIVRQAP